MLEPRKQATRIQTSLINPYEKKALVWLANRQPSWMTSDKLTFIGFVGAFMIGIGYFLTNYSPAWLWLASAGFFVNWYGDSLDGSFARVHHQQRPMYGYFLDHMMDGINEFIMFIGAGLCPLLNTSIALLVYIAYLLLTVYQNIYAHVMNEFKLTYGKLGPTEFRILVVIVNVILYFNWETISLKTETVEMFGKTISLGLFDYFAMGAFVILMFFYLNSFFQSKKKLAKLDPLIKEDK